MERLFGLLESKQERRGYQAERVTIEGQVVNTSKKPTKAERAQRVVEAQQQALKLQKTLATLRRGIHKTRDSDLIEAFEWLMSFLTASFEKTADLENEKQDVRLQAALSNRKFSDAAFDAVARDAKSDKDIARKLKVSPGTIARYKARKKRGPSFTEEILREVRASRKNRIAHKNHDAL